MNTLENQNAIFPKSEKAYVDNITFLGYSKKK